VSGAVMVSWGVWTGDRRRGQVLRVWLVWLRQSSLMDGNLSGSFSLKLEVLQG
jgi:hypothetical protein